MTTPETFQNPEQQPASAFNAALHAHITAVLLQQPPQPDGRAVQFNTVSGSVRLSDYYTNFTHIRGTEAGQGSIEDALAEDAAILSVEFAQATADGWTECVIYRPCDVRLGWNLARLPSEPAPGFTADEYAVFAGNSFVANPQAIEQLSELSDNLALSSIYESAA